MQKEFICQLNEGFNLTQQNGVYYVEMTDEHESSVDTSVQNNPKKETLDIELENSDKIIEVPVVSIFTRRNYDYPYSNMDGNPVLYALKNENGYRFKSYKKDTKFIEEHFKNIFKNYFNLRGKNLTVISPTYNNAVLPKTGIVVPTTSTVNKMIARLIKEIGPDINFIDDIIFKMNVEEIKFQCQLPDSYFYKYFEKKYDYPGNYVLRNILPDLGNTLDAMSKQTKGIFRKHLLRNKDYRQAIVHTMQLSKSCGTYYKQINGKDILLIDDTLTFGQSIEEAVNLILSAYSPKSITVLTMFSRKVNY